MKLLKLLLLVSLISVPVSAQTLTKTFAWDKSIDDTRDPANPNPVKYRFYTCPNTTYLGCAVTEVGISLELSKTILAGTSYVYVTAYWNSFLVDGISVEGIAESGKSNILKLELKSPPGNPANAKLKITQIASSESGQRLRK